MFSGLAPGRRIAARVTRTRGGEAMTQLTVPDSALGHHYQSWWALLLLWDAISIDELAAVSVEKYDDVAVETSAESKSFQLKRHGSVGNLTDASSDLWKTIKSWLLQRRLITDVTFQRLCLTTTQTAASGSAAAALRPAPYRDVPAAMAILDKVAQTSASKDNKPAYELYKKVSRGERFRFLDSMFVIDQSCDLDTLLRDLQRRVSVAVGKQNAAEATIRLLGWWEQRLVAHLQSTATDRITALELHERLELIRHSFREDNLVIDDDIFELIEPDTLKDDAGVLIEQLRLLAHDNKAIALALKDYFRAFVQRQRWTMGRLVRTGEIDAYEARLKREWDNYWATRVPPEPKCAGKSEGELADIGRRTYNDITSLPLAIRPLCVDQMIVRGSYHILANAREVGWHPLFIQRLADILGERSA